MALRGPGNGPSEATAIEAYERHRDGESWREIATAMAGPPHNCGGHTTAGRWIAIGHALVTRDDNGKVHSMRRRRARRDMAIDALDAIRAEMSADALLAREAMYRLRILAIEKAARIGGYQAPPPATRVKVTGAGGGQVPRELIESLLALPPDELREALGSPPPDY